MAEVEHLVPEVQTGHVFEGCGPINIFKGNTTVLQD